MRNLKRSLATSLALAMVVQMSMPVLAKDSSKKNKETSSSQTEQYLKVLSTDTFTSKDVATPVSDLLPAEATWTTLTSDTVLDSTDTPYYLYLSEDLATPLTIPENITVHLCLNGHTMTVAETGSVITVSETATLSLYDSVEKAESHWAWSEDGTTYVVADPTSEDFDPTSESYDIYSGGIITGGTQSAIQNLGSFTMYGGNIVGNTGTTGGAVHNEGNFTLVSGTIASNRAEEQGDGIYQNGTFTIGLTEESAILAEGYPIEISDNDVYLTEEKLITMGTGFSIVDTIPVSMEVEGDIAEEGSIAYFSSYDSAYGIATMADTYGVAMIATKTGIGVDTTSATLEYIEGQNFSTTGLRVYKNSNDTIITTGLTFSYYETGTSTTPQEITTATKLNDDGTYTVIVSYVDGSDTYKAYYEITVKEKEIDSISVATAPTKVVYTVGETFDPKGLVINANYNNNTSANIPYNDTDFSFDPSTSLAIINTSVTITYGGKNVTQAITVNEANKTALENAITAAEDNLASVFVSTNGDDVYKTAQWVTQTDYNAYEQAIADAQAVVNDVNATQAKVNAALDTLNTATTAFDSKKQIGTSTTVDQIAQIILNNDGRITVYLGSDGKFYDSTLTNEVDDAVINPSKVGYIFDGWFTHETSGNLVDLTTLKGNNIFVYAQWTQSSLYTITFDSNGGTTHDPQTTGADGTLSTLPNPTCDGYTFNYWYIDGSTSTAVNTFTTFTKDTTLYAKWTLDSSSGGGSTGGGGGSSSGSGSSGNSGSVTSSITTPVLNVGSGGTASVSPSRIENGKTGTITVDPRTGFDVDTLTIFDSNRNEISVTKQDDNTYTFTQPVTKVFISVTFGKGETTTPDTDDDTTKPDTDNDDYPTVKPEDLFYDVNPSDWYYDAVQYVLASGLMGGAGNGSFNPNGDMTRGMIVTVLYNLAKQPTLSPKVLFSDVSAGDYFYYPSLWASQLGIVAGIGDNLFDPHQSITREQMYVILYKYAITQTHLAGSLAPEANFADSSSVSVWAKTGVNWCYSKGLIILRDGGKLEPQAPANRAEIAQMLMALAMLS